MLIFSEPDVSLKFDKIKRTLLYMRNSLFPKSPKTFQELKEAFENEEVLKVFGHSKSDQNNPFYRTTNIVENRAFTIFASEDIIRLINTRVDKSKMDILMDSTFKICPEGEFKQLLIIHLKYFNKVNKIIYNYYYLKCSLLLFFLKVVPFMFILMNGKRQQLYRDIFLYIKENLIDFECNSFLTDYETGMRNALREIYPNVQLLACWFHYCQAIRKMIKKLHMTRKISTNKQIRSLYFKFLCISLLPADKIEEAFLQLKLQCNATDMTFFADFLKYYERQWLRKVSHIEVSCRKWNTVNTPRPCQILLTRLVYLAVSNF